MKSFGKTVLQLALALLFLVAPSATVLAQGSKPVLVISISNFDELFGDIRAITEAAGAADAGNMVTGLAGLYTNGIDKSKPLGAYVTLENDQPRVIVFVPVKNLKGTLAMFQEQIGAPRDVGDGILQVAADKPQPLYIKEQNGWAFIAQSSSHLGTLPEDPSVVLGGLDKKYDLAIRINVQNIPAQFKQLAINELKKGFQQSLKNVAQGDREATEKLGSGSLQGIVRVVEETDQITVGLALDGKTRRTYLESSLTAIAGTELAKQMADLKNMTSAHTGFVQPGAAATLNMSSKMAQEDIAQIVAMVNTLREKAMKEIDNDPRVPDAKTRDEAKSIVGSLIDVAQKTVENGKTDGGAVLVLENKSLGFAAGATIADGLKVEAALKRLVALAKDEKDFPKINFNQETHEGVNFHSLTVPLRDADPDARRIFGDQLDIVLGTGKESLYIAIGTSPASLLKTVITKSGSGLGQLVPLAQLNVALGPILKFAAAVDNDPKVKALASVVDQAGGKDHLMITATPIERGAVYRFEVEEGILKIIGAAAKAQQQRGF